MLIGHEIQTRYFDTQIITNCIHRAYLLEGIKGLGKATFARAISQKILGGSDAESLMRAGSHPDFTELKIQEDTKTGKLRRDITRDQVEKLLIFMMRHPVIAKHKVVLIDAADDLNLSAANNLLKWIEEPRPNTCVLMVAHRPERLLPTIRSRCTRIVFKPLSKSDFDIFTEENELPNTAAFYELSGGVPGQAITMNDPNVQKVNALMAGLVQKQFQADPLEINQSVSALLPSTDLEGLTTSFRLLRYNLRIAAGQGANARVAEIAAQAYTLAQGREAQAKSLNVDPKHVLVSTLLDLRDLSREGRADG